MSRVRYDNNTYPGPDDFSFSELKHAVEFYKELLSTCKNNTGMTSAFAKEFGCTKVKAMVLHAAAEFHYKMELKGVV